jgi:hypothetical protein
MAGSKAASVGRYYKSAQPCFLASDGPASDTSSSRGSPSTGSSSSVRGDGPVRPAARTDSDGFFFLERATFTPTCMRPLFCIWCKKVYTRLILVCTGQYLVYSWFAPFKKLTSNAVNLSMNQLGLNLLVNSSALKYCIPQNF